LGQLPSGGPHLTTTGKKPAKKKKVKHHHLPDGGPYVLGKPAERSKGKGGKGVKKKKKAPTAQNGPLKERYKVTTALTKKPEGASASKRGSERGGGENPSLGFGGSPA